MRNLLYKRKTVFCVVLLQKQKNILKFFLKMPICFFVREDNVYLESEASMSEALSLVIFAAVMYFCLVVAPTIMEYFKSEDYKKVMIEQTSLK